MKYKTSGETIMARFKICEGSLEFVNDVIHVFQMYSIIFEQCTIMSDKLIAQFLI